MKNFVKMIMQAHEERFFVVTNKILSKKIPVAFMSVESITQAVEHAKDFRKQGLNVTTLFVIDSAPPPANLEFNVVHISNSAKIFPQPEYVFVMDFQSPMFVKKFMGDRKIIFPYSIRGLTNEQVYEIFMSHLSDLQEVYESLIDEESKKTFRGYWLGCICNRIDEVVSADTPHYFLHGFIPKPNDIFIDCGSYTGWTAAQFAKLGCKVYSFEMNKTNFEMAKEMASEYGFTVENLGLGSYPHKANYINNKGASRLDPNGSETTSVITLDSYVREKNLPRVDFIKMDVEGSELDVLKGAAISIACWKPVLALSAYHKLDDLWTLMNFVKSIRPDYEFAMRQYPTTYESSPQIFGDDLKNIFGSLGLDMKYYGYEECVLFAR